MQHQTVDLIETLRRIEQRAVKARRSLAAGTATSGATALEQIRAEASDAVARTEKRGSRRVSA